MGSMRRSNEQWRPAERRSPPAALLLAWIVTLSTGCQQELPESHAAQSESPLRIVSLSPAISRTLVDLDLGESVVGRTPFCDSLSRSIPVVGDQQSVDYERLVRLRPTHLLIQLSVTGVDPELIALADRYGWSLGQWRLDTIEDVERMVGELPGLLAPEPNAEHRALSNAASTLRNALVRCRTVDRSGPVPPWTGRVLLVSHIEPVMVFGQETYLDELVTALGSTNAVRARGWATLSLEDVVRMRPDAVVVVSPQLRPAENGDWAGPLAELDIPAVHEGRIAMLAHPDAFLPASSVVEVAGEMRSILRSFAEGPP